jgi:hypothetical protein
MQNWLRTHILPRRHTTYFELLDALDAPGCALCRLTNARVALFFHHFSYEGVNDPGLRPQLRAARGFCRAHGWQFAQEVRNSPARAIIYRDVLGTVAQLAGALRGSALAPAERLLPTAACPVCQSQAHTLRRYLGTLLVHLPRPELRAHYQSSAGLCLPHLLLTLARLREPADAELFLGVAARRVDGLRVSGHNGMRPHTAAIVATVVGSPGAMLPLPACTPGEWPPPAGDAQADASAPTGPVGTGCPACLAGIHAAEGWLRDVPSPCHSHDVEPSSAPALGLCNAHAWRSLELLSPGAAARLWQPAARSLKGLPGAGSGGSWAGLGAHLAHGADRGAGACPACRAQGAAEVRVARASIEAGAGQGLCLPHLALALRLACDFRRRHALLVAQSAALVGLIADLDEYIRKQNYRVREDPGPEADAPRRALAYAAGAEGLRATPVGWEQRGMLPSGPKPGMVAAIAGLAGRLTAGAA